MPKLTKTIVDNAEPRDRQYTVWCSDLKGFGVFVLPSSTRTYGRDELGIIEANPAHGVRKPKDVVRKRWLNEEEYRTFGRILAKAAEDDRYTRTADIIRLIAMSGCQRGEIIEAQKAEIDTVGSACRFEDTKEGHSVRPMGLPVVEYFDERNMGGDSPYVFPARGTRPDRLEVSRAIGKRFSSARNWRTSPPMCCVTASPASPTISGLPRLRSRRCSVTPRA